VGVGRLFQGNLEEGETIEVLGDSVSDFEIGGRTPIFRERADVVVTVASSGGGGLVQDYHYLWGVVPKKGSRSREQILVVSVPAQ